MEELWRDNIPLKTRILFVDEDPEVLDNVKSIVHQKDPELEVITSHSTQEAVDQLEQHDFDIVISDYLVPESIQQDLLESLKKGRNRIGFVMWMGDSQLEVTIKALNIGSEYLFLKGSDIKYQFDIIGEMIDKIVATKSRKEPESIGQKSVSELMHKLSHDITGILQNIVGYTTLLEEEYDKSCIEGISRLVSKLSNRIKTAVSEIDSSEFSESTEIQ